VRHLVTGVTASQALIEAARDRGADAILVTTVISGAQSHPALPA